jgi:hypothetical protein
VPRLRAVDVDGARFNPLVITPRPCSIHVIFKRARHRLRWHRNTLRRAVGAPTAQLLHRWARARGPCGSQGSGKVRWRLMIDPGSWVITQLDGGRAALFPGSSTGGQVPAQR